MTFIILAHRSKYSIAGPAVKPVTDRWGNILTFDKKGDAEYEMQYYIASNSRTPHEVRYSVATLEGMLPD